MSGANSVTGTANSGSSPTPGRLRRRRWIFRGILLLLCWLVVELVSWATMFVMIAGGPREVMKSQAALYDMLFHVEAFRDAGAQTQTLHPFVGWVRNPEVLKTETYEGTTLTTNRFGFLDTTEGLFRRDPQRLIVGVTGGSVAYQLSCAGAEALRESLRSIPEYQNREIVFVRMAQSAYKQPQGLYALNYYMLQGGEFDIVINLDGLNEVTMTLDQNYRLKVALDYPQGWKMRTAELISPQESDLAAELILIRGQRRKLAVAAYQSPLRRLPSQLLLWQLRENRMREQLIELQERYTRDDAGHHFVRCGPEPVVKTTEEALRESIRIWKQASIQMHRLCQASGILYLHAIQPNQYDPGAKPLTEEELDYMKPNSPGNRDQAFPEIIKAAYPLLREGGTQLKAEGVRVLDLTRIFADVSESLYVDSCCHVRPKGSEIMARAIGAEIQSAVREKVPSNAP